MIPLWGSGSRAFVSPASLSNLVLWYDASNLGSITKNGSQQVSQVSDLSGNNRHATITAGTWVTYDTVKFPAGGIKFNDQNAMSIAGCPASDTWTTVMVLSWATINTFAALGIRNAFDNTLSIRAEVASDGTTNNRMVGLSGGAAGNAYQAAANTFTAGNHCVTFQHQASSGTGLLRNDGSSVTVPVNTSLASASQAWNYFGSGVVGTSYTGNGQAIAELVTYNRALSITEIQQVEAYLKAKWGTP